jgi:hypothetical protein
MDLPNAEIHRLDSGHFAVEDSLDYIATIIRRFYDEKVAAKPGMTAMPAMFEMTGMPDVPGMSDGSDMSRM